jgi:hypothetical protein
VVTGLFCMVICSLYRCCFSVLIDCFESLCGVSLCDGVGYVWVVGSLDVCWLYSFVFWNEKAYSYPKKNMVLLKPKENSSARVSGKETFGNSTPTVFIM